MTLPVAALIACHTPSTVEEKDAHLHHTTTFTIDPRSGQYDGPFTRTDSTGTVLEKGYYHSGALQGIRELYYPDGTVNVRERYANGKITDLYEYFHPNGQLELKGYYIGGAMYGIWKKYDDAGHLLEEVTMADNEEQGPFREYHPNGKLKAEGAYLNGPNEDGTLKLYDEEGQLQKEMLCYAGRCYTQWEKK